MSSPSIESLDEGRISFEKTPKTDPVCGKTVDLHSPETTSAVHGGITYFFCSKPCKEQFVEHRPSSPQP